MSIKEGGEIIEGQDLNNLKLEDLANLIISIGQELKKRKEPVVSQEGLSQAQEQRKHKKGEPIKVEHLLEKLPLLSRTAAQQNLEKISVRELGNLCRRAGIPFSAKNTPKEKLIQSILRHFYDSPLGWETLENLVIKRPEEVLQFQDSRAFYDANFDSLLATYEGKYIAILRDKVIDSDEFFSRLAERVYQREGYKDIFMPKVQKQVQVISIPSPSVRAGEDRNV